MMKISGIPDFTAFDFETAMLGKNPCQVGIVVVRNYKIIIEICGLIQPPGNKYHDSTIDIHHIAPEMTCNSPAFPEIWKEISNYIDGQIVVAHNARYDIKVLKGILEYYNLPPAEPSAVYDTMTALGTSFSLVSAAAACHIEFDNHHDALFDAECCAKIFLAAQSPDLQLDFDAAAKASEEEKASKAQQAKSPRPKIVRHEPIDKKYLRKEPSPCVNPASPFYGKRIAITGEFSFSRDEVAGALCRLGAQIVQTVGRQTDFVITGDNPGPSKMKKLCELQKEGCAIEQITEQDLICACIEFPPLSEEKSEDSEFGLFDE